MWQHKLWNFFKIIFSHESLIRNLFLNYIRLCFYHSLSLIFYSLHLYINLDGIWFATNPKILTIYGYLFVWVIEVEKE